MVLRGPLVTEGLPAFLPAKTYDGQGWPVNPTVERRSVFPIKSNDVLGQAIKDRQVIPDFSQSGPFGWPIRKDVYSSPTPALVETANGGATFAALGGKAHGVRQISRWASNSSVSTSSTRTMLFPYIPIGTMIAMSTNENTVGISAISSDGYDWRSWFSLAITGSRIYVWLGRRVGVPSSNALSITSAGQWRGHIILEIPQLVGELIAYNSQTSTTGQNMTPADVTATRGRSDEYYFGARHQVSGGSSGSAPGLDGTDSTSAQQGVFCWGDPWSVNLGGVVGGTFTSARVQDSVAFHAIIR